MNEIEIKEITGFPRYYASTDGKIYGPRYGFNNPKKFHIDSGGYFIVTLRENGGKGESKRIRVHKIIAETFIKNINNLSNINHKDGNKQNNSVDNLEYCSYSYNLKHSYNIGTHPKPNHQGERHSNHILTEKDIKEIRIIWNNTINKKKLASRIAERYNVSRTCVCNVVYNWTWKHI